MTDYDIAEILKTSSPSILYIVNRNGCLQRLKCPFKVKVLIDIASLSFGELVLVDEIKVTHEMVTVFVIKDEYYLEASKIFDNHYWPLGDYKASMTLFGMFRFAPGTITSLITAIFLYSLFHIISLSSGTILIILFSSK